MTDDNYDQRDHMERVIGEGGSVYHDGAIIANRSQLPSAAKLAKGDPRREEAARGSIESRRAALDAEERELQPDKSAKSDKAR